MGGPRLPRRGGADRRGDRQGRGHVPQRPPVGLPAARRHARSAADRSAVLRLHRRRHGPLRDRRRAAPGHALGPRARPEQPVGDRLGQRAHHLHPRHRRGDGPGQRGHERGPAAPLHPQPAAGLDATGAPEITAAADLLRRAAERLRRHRCPPDDEFDYPTGSSDDGAAPRRAGRDDAASTSTRR